MPSVELSKDHGRETVSRRDFLRVGGLGVVGLSVAEQSARARSRAMSDRPSSILILMNGGASQLETFDPKPEAPVEFRGPLKSISTAIPGVAFSESLPLLAERAGKLAVLRSLHHKAAAIHETGLQILQTGRLSQSRDQFPSFGSVVSQVRGRRHDVVPYAVVPRRMGNMGVHRFHGQGAGILGAAHEPVSLPPHDALAPDSAAVGEDPFAGLMAAAKSDPALRLYGDTRFGRLCWLARQLVELGVRCVTVNLFDSLTSQVTWDCHARKPGAPATLYDYRDTLCPQFDKAVAALIDDLEQRGLLGDTLVTAVGEFGRTPQLNDAGGRDHWPHAWSAIMAGGGVVGGQVIGATDRYGMQPVDRPIGLPELTASLYTSLGVDPASLITLSGGREARLVEHEPIHELFG